MENIETVITALLAVAGGITVLYNAGKAIYNMAAPGRNIKKRVEAVEDYIDNHKVQTATLETKLDSLDTTNKVMCQCLLVMLEHEITGNSIDKLKVTKQELQEYLINK